MGYTNEKITIYLATELTKGERHLADDEDITVVEIDLDELKSMLDKNEIITASTTIALMHYIMYEENNKN